MTRLGRRTEQASRGALCVYQLVFVVILVFLVIERSAECPLQQRLKVLSEGVIGDDKGQAVVQPQPGELAVDALQCIGRVSGVMLNLLLVRVRLRVRIRVRIRVGVRVRVMG